MATEFEDIATIIFRRIRIEQSWLKWNFQIGSTKATAFAVVPTPVVKNVLITLNYLIGKSPSIGVTIKITGPSVRRIRASEKRSFSIQEKINIADIITNWIFSKLRNIQN